MMLTGIAMENMLSKIIRTSNINCIFQDKKVLELNDEISLTVIPDYIFDDILLEVKFPFYLKDYTKIPNRYKYQLECEYRLFNKKVMLGLFCIPFDIKFLEYTPSINRWNEIKTILFGFHKQIKNYIIENNIDINNIKKQYISDDFYEKDYCKEVLGHGMF